ncbi:MAG: hypothetical protein LC623_04950, partial [Halobacteriales archaeon]|nr:hypothetical protein [Halobacteriales archaeon]
MRTLLFASCAALLLLAGCTDTATTTTTSGTTGPGGMPGAAKPDVVRDDGTITASGGVGVTLTIPAIGAAPDVQGNVTLLYAELRWTGPADLD